MRTRRSTAALTTWATVTIAVTLAASVWFYPVHRDQHQIAADDYLSGSIGEVSCFLDESAGDFPEGQVTTVAGAQPETLPHLQSAPSSPRKQVLILVGPQYGLPMVQAITPVMVTALQESGFSLDDIFVEFLDIHRIANGEHADNVLTLLQHKLEGRDIGLIIAVNQGAVDFIAREGHHLSPDAPLLIPIREKDPTWAGTQRQVMVLSSRQDVDGTLQHALALFPSTKRVLIIMGQDDHEAPFLAPIHEALEALPRDLEVEDTSALSYEEMLAHIDSLPPDTIALYGSYFDDVTGRPFVPAEVAAAVAETANSPVFAFRDMHILQGLIGGSVVTTAELGRQAVAIGVQYLDGQIQLTEQTTVFEITNAPLFDYEVIQHFGGDHGALPGNTVFLNRPPSLWEEHREAVITALIAFLVLVMVSTGLVTLNRRLQRALSERARAQQSLAQSEEQFRSLFFDSVAPMSLISTDARVIEANQAWLNLFGYSREELAVLDATRLYPHPEQRSEFIAEIAGAGHVTDQEVRLKKKDGTLLDVARSVSVRRSSGGTVIGYHNVLRDISELKAAECVRRASEQKYRSLFEQSVDAIVLVAPDGMGMEANQSWLDLFGYTREELPHVNARDIYADPVDRGDFLRRIAEVGFVKDLVRFKRKDGTVFDCQRSVVALKDDEGVTVGFLNVKRDITEERDAQERLRRSATLLDRSQQIGHVGSWELDLRANHLTWSDETYRIFGHEPQEFAATYEAFLDSIHPEDRARVYESYAASVREGRDGYEIEHRIVRGDSDEIRLIHEKCVHERDAAGSIVRSIGMVEDITERNAAEAARRESEEQYRSLFEQSREAIAVVEPSGRILEANEAWLELFGYALGELPTIRMHDLYARPEDRDDFLRRISEQGSVQDEVRHLKKDGTVIDCHRSSVAKRNEGGEIIAIQTLVLNITERKRAEERLQQSFAQLERALQGTLDVIERIVETRDPYTAGHQKRVAELAVAIAHHMRLPEDSCVSLIGTAALIHDIGKIAVPSEILSKPGKLSEPEFLLIKAHPRVAYDILKQAELPYPVPEIVLQHHERYDGTGYPSGLCGDDILPEASILAVADVVEAMYSHRPYRAGLGIDAAIGEIRDGSGTRYHPDVVDACIAAFRDGGFTFSA